MPKTHGCINTPTRKDWLVNGGRSSVGMVRRVRVQPVNKKSGAVIRGVKLEFRCEGKNLRDKRAARRREGPQEIAQRG